MKEKWRLGWAELGWAGLGWAGRQYLIMKVKTAPRPRPRIMDKMMK